MGPVCLICLPSCLVLVGLEWMKGSLVHLFRFPTLHPLGGPHPPGVDTISALNESPKTLSHYSPSPHSKVFLHRDSNESFRQCCSMPGPFLYAGEGKPKSELLELTV